MAIIIKSEKHLIEVSNQLYIEAHELRFWDQYYQVNKGQYGKTKRDMYMRKVDDLLKKLRMTNAERLKTIQLIFEMDHY